MAPVPFASLFKEACRWYSASSLAIATNFSFPVDDDNDSGMLAVVVKVSATDGEKSDPNPVSRAVIVNGVREKTADMSDTAEMDEAQDEVIDAVPSDPAEEDVDDMDVDAVEVMGVKTLREDRREEVSLDRLRPKIKTCSLKVTRLPLAVDAVVAGPKLLERVLANARRILVE